MSGLRSSVSQDWRTTGRGYVDAAGGIWRSQLSGEAKASARPALFLDRDGVVVEEVDYLSRPQDVRLTENAGTAIAQASQAGWLVIVVTNQSGIARGYFDWSAFEAVHEEIDRQLARFGAAFDAVFACGYHDGGGRPELSMSHPWRKPGPGMIAAGVSDFGADPSRSYIVGDKASDLWAGKAAALAGGFLVSTGYGGMDAQIKSAQDAADTSFSVERVENLFGAWRQLQVLVSNTE